MFNNKLVILAAVRDISEITKNDLLLHRKNAELEILNSQKDKFFSIIAHDLKSPFNAILGFSELLVEQVNEQDYSGVEKFANIIHKSSERAMDLLSNLMVWSRSQTGRLEFNPEFFEIVDLINDVILLLAEAAHQKTIIITKKLPRHAPVFGDKHMIHTVMRNLVTNAIKFTREGGEICISLEEIEGNLKISVADNGVGISSESLSKLSRIDQDHTTLGTNNEKGTGLGLILCKEFIEKHEGKIEVKSEKNSGSIFYISIPQSNNQLS